MQAIVIPQLRLTFLAVLIGLILPPGAGAQQVERYSMAEDDVAIYNLAGEVRMEAGSGSAIVAQVTRGGADAGSIEGGARRGGRPGDPAGDLPGRPDPVWPAVRWLVHPAPGAG